MQGKNILITGGTAGMGKATALQLAKMGAQLLLIGRNDDKGKAAVAEIIRASGSKTVTFLQADLSLIYEMRRAADQIRQLFARLDVMIQAADDIVTLLTGEYPGGFYERSLKQHEFPAANSSAVRLWDYSLKQVDSLLAQP